MKDFRELIDNGLLGGEGVFAKTFFWLFLASQYVRPGWLLYHAIGLVGLQGAGKSWICTDLLTQLLGQDMSCVQKVRQWFEEKYNESMEKALSGMIDEYEHVKELINDVKFQITAQTFTLRKMHKDPKPGTQCVTNWFFTSNSEDAFCAELLHRRVTVYNVGKGIKDPRFIKYDDKRWNWHDIAAYLLTYEEQLKTFNPKTPLTAGTVLSKDDCPPTPPATPVTINGHTYASVVGAMMYAMLGTRPDLAYSVGCLSRFNSNPGTTHVTALKHVLRYLAGTTDY